MDKNLKDLPRVGLEPSMPVSMDCKFSSVTMGVPKNDPEDLERPIRPTEVKGWSLFFGTNFSCGSFFDSPKKDPLTEKRPTDLKTTLD